MFLRKALRELVSVDGDQRRFDPRRRATLVSVVDLLATSENARELGYCSVIRAERVHSGAVVSSAVAPRNDPSKPASAGLEVLVDFSNFSNFTMIDFMIWKGVALVIGAIIYGFWLGLTGR
ncbi:hypothetical protein [Pseudomonas sp. URMO17WK12:I12]|uniref:hypothetical protein n=1 Tax=Pseudomonas sp. URMO17WK12:I12 TaxID=1259797 RepID=UPI0012DD8228|nr:hypothetical protein [Pseudomonas sp. URMO17WK12:I12]